mmetsp:Transcript_103384/g.200306  ORF Transcript_103384/g.200306 Transcript_103384/m.200306 type:complete len:272 (-) Transcript_103384:513-1328(-)
MIAVPRLTHTAFKRREMIACSFAPTSHFTWMRSHHHASSQYQRHHHGTKRLVAAEGGNSHYPSRGRRTWPRRHPALLGHLHHSTPVVGPRGGGTMAATMLPTFLRLALVNRLRLLSMQPRRGARLRAAAPHLSQVRKFHPLLLQLGFHQKLQEQQQKQQQQHLFATLIKVLVWCLEAASQIPLTHIRFRLRWWQPHTVCLRVHPAQPLPRWCLRLRHWLAAKQWPLTIAIAHWNHLGRTCCPLLQCIRQSSHHSHISLLHHHRQWPPTRRR